MQLYKSPLPGSLHLARAISRETHLLFPRDRGLGLLAQQVPGMHGLCSCPHTLPPDPVCILFPLRQKGWVTTIDGHMCMIGEYGWGSRVTPEIVWSERVVGGATARFAY